MCIQLLPLVGGVLSGLGSLAASRAQADAYEAQADLYENQAEMEAERGRYEADRITRQARMLAGRQVANYAASGIKPTGSAAAVIDDTAAEAALDIRAIRYGSEARAQNLMTNAQYQKQNAAAVRQGAIFGFLSPVIGGAAKTDWATI